MKALFLLDGSGPSSGARPETIGKVGYMFLAAALFPPWAAHERRTTDQERAVPAQPVRVNKFLTDLR